MSLVLNLDTSLDGLPGELIDTPIVMGIFQEYKPLHGYNGIVDWEVCGEVSRMIAAREFDGKEKTKTLLYLTVSCYPGRKVLLYGLGAKKRLTPERLSSITDDLFAALSSLSIHSLVHVLPPLYDTGADMRNILDSVAHSMLQFTSTEKMEYKLWLMWDNVSHSDIIRSFKDAVNIFSDASLSIIEKED